MPRDSPGSTSKASPPKAKAKPKWRHGPVSGGPQFAGVDQGVDFTGRGKIHSVDDAVITRVVRSGSGWPGEGALVVYRLTSGPRAGSYVYVAEDLKPTVKAGQRVRAGQVIGIATGSGRAPGIEMGWSDANGSPLAPLSPNPHGPKAQGRDFWAFVSGNKTGVVGPGDPGTNYMPYGGSNAGSSLGGSFGSGSPGVQGADILPDFTTAPVGVSDALGPVSSDPGTVSAQGFTPRLTQQLWQTLANQPNASPESLAYAQQTY